MGIASLMSTGIIERSKEIGLMKALGAYQWQIALLFYCEAIISALIGGSLGCIAGWGLAKLSGTPNSAEPINLAKPQPAIQPSEPPIKALIMASQ